MCDTFVALGSATADGSVILGKNSDREPNEAHEIQIIPAADHPQGSLVRCTYRSIPQVSHTFAVILAKPFWIWGAEMGVNEHGVAIGNEAIFTRVPYEKGEGLIGMDFLRLALERARTALDALYTITSLLEAYGQGGNCGFTHPFYYHNSFLLADPSDAWVLETAGKQWVAEKVRNVRAISNAATIGKTWDLASDDLVHFALEQGLCKRREDFDFARCYSDVLYTTLSDARARHGCTMDMLNALSGQVTPAQAAAVLRAHGPYPAQSARLDRAFLGATVCMHAGAGPVRGSQSVGSMLAHLQPGRAACWVTATSAPCTSIFKPVWVDAAPAMNEPALTGKFDPGCMWWRHELLHRLTLLDYPTHISLYQRDRDALEAKFFEEAGLCDDSADARRAFSERCFQQADAAEARWLERARATEATRAPRFYYTAAWKGWNQAAAMPPDLRASR
jgi:dipeptidase